MAENFADPALWGVSGQQQLYLEVFINGRSTNLVASVRQESDGRLLMPADELKGVGLLPGGAPATDDGFVRIDELAGATYRFEEATQSLHFEANDEARVRRKIEAGDDTGVSDLESGIGAVLNYSLFGNFSSDEIFELPTYEGISGSFDTRLFSPLGVIEHGFIATTSPSNSYASTRLATTWSYSNPSSMVTYRAGDIITGGLTWTRPVRLGGAQLQRSFRLRPDLVTTPVPELTGSAAVPSTVEIYTNNIRRFSGDVEAGPFEVSSVPLINGPGTVRIIVRDQFGRETIEEVPFYSSPRMLAPGLSDFSLDAGFARRDFGLASDSYDDRFMASGSFRYGVTPRLTVEAHAEGGDGLISGGGAALFNIGAFGLATVHGASSYFEGDTGYQIGASVEAAIAEWRFFASTQRTFGEYNDIASVTAKLDPALPFRYGSVPEAIDQVTVSPPPLPDGSTINLSFAHVKEVGFDRSMVVGGSYSRPFIGSSTLHAHAYANLAHGESYGAFVGLSLPLGRASASSGIQADSQGTRVRTDIIRPLDPEPWSVGWRMSDSEGDVSERQASISMRTPVARVEATARQLESASGFTAQVTGAVAAIGGDIFLSERIHDAFAVVDAGVPNVAVKYQNRFVGKTNRDGKLLVSQLNSLHEAALEIDPTNLPVDIDVPVTRETVTLAEKSGLVVEFGASGAAAAALVTLRTLDDELVPVGSEGSLIGSEETFLVGYDGQTYIRGLSAKNQAEIRLPDGSSCLAEFTYRPVEGEQVAISDVTCR